MIRFGDRLQGFVQIPGMRLASHIQQVRDGQGLMHPDQRFPGGVDVAAYQRQVDVARTPVVIGHHPERPIHGLQRAFRASFDQRFSAAAMLDQVGDGADFQAVPVGELDQVRQARHLAVILEDLADHRRGHQPRK